MEKLNLKAYIGNRIRVLRLQKGLTQQELEELADLPLKYVYKVERLEPNIKIDTFEKLLSALNTNIEDFFDITLHNNDILTTELVTSLMELPIEKREKILNLIIPLIKEIT